MKIQLSKAPRQNIKRNEKIGDCFKKDNHYYFVDVDNVLHVKIHENDYCINTLYDNYITTSKIAGGVFKKISFEEFSLALNTAVFEMKLYHERFNG